MPIIFKRRGDSAPATSLTAPTRATAPTADFPVPTRGPASVQSVAIKPGPKVLKLGSAKEAAQPADAAVAPALHKPLTKVHHDNQEPPRYPTVYPGERVTITSTMFPWVKHYKAGDSGVVRHLMGNRDPLGVDNDGSHQMHIIDIDQPVDASRKGQSAGLFRWEFSRPQDIGVLPSGQPPKKPPK